jgi:glutaredoxin-related protein
MIALTETAAAKVKVLLQTRTPEADALRVRVNAGGCSGLRYDSLQGSEVRDDIKTYTSWPTIPQLYVDAEFVGGCDIVTETYVSGELEKLVQPAGAGDPDD